MTEIKYQCQFCGISPMDLLPNQSRCYRNLHHGLWHDWQLVSEPVTADDLLVKENGYTAKQDDTTGYLIMDDIELQLLVIDLGDSCVVKVEKAAKSICIIGAEINPRDSFDFRRNSFADIREAIDAMDDEPPVPRIEQHDSGGYWIFTKGWGDALAQCSYDALSELAGKPLPVWERRRGEWKQLARGGPVGVTGLDLPSDFIVWRYTRRAK